MIFLFKLPSFFSRFLVRFQEKEKSSPRNGSLTLLRRVNACLLGSKQRFIILVSSSFQSQCLYVLFVFFLLTSRGFLMSRFTWRTYTQWLTSLQISTGHWTFVWQIWCFDRWMLSLTGHADRALLLCCEIWKYISTWERQTRRWT